MVQGSLSFIPPEIVLELLRLLEAILLLYSFLSGSSTGRAFGLQKLGHKSRLIGQEVRQIFVTAPWPAAVGHEHRQPLGKA